MAYEVPAWLQWSHGLLSDLHIPPSDDNVRHPLILGYYEEAAHFIQRGDLSLRSASWDLFGDMNAPVEAYEFLSSRFPLLQITADQIPSLLHPLTCHLLEKGALCFVDLEGFWYQFPTSEFETFWKTHRNSAWLQEKTPTSVLPFLLGWIRSVKCVPHEQMLLQQGKTLWEQCHTHPHVLSLMQPGWDAGALLQASVRPMLFIERRVLDSLASRDQSLFLGTLAFYVLYNKNRSLF